MNLNRPILIIGSRNGLGLQLGTKLREGGNVDITFMLHPLDHWISHIAKSGFKIKKETPLDLGFLAQAILPDMDVYHMGPVIFLSDYKASIVYLYNVVGLANVVDVGLDQRINSLTYLGSSFGIFDPAVDHLQMLKILHLGNVEAIRGHEEGLNTQLVLPGLILKSAPMPSGIEAQGKVLVSSEVDIVTAMVQREPLVKTQMRWCDLNNEYILESDLSLNNNRTAISKCIEYFKYRKAAKKMKLYFDSDFQHDTYGDNTT